MFTMTMNARFRYKTTIQGSSDKPPRHGLRVWMKKVYSMPDKGLLRTHRNEVVKRIDTKHVRALWNRLRISTTQNDIPHSFKRGTKILNKGGYKPRKL